MRLYSNPESAARLEVSILALLETLGAVALTLWVVTHKDTWTHIAIGAAIAPFTLLRTEESTARGLIWADETLHRWLDNDDIVASSPIKEAILFSIVAPIWFLSIRLGAIVVSTVITPADALQAIPRNFARACISTDSAHPPEVIPGIETHRHVFDAAARVLTIPIIPKMIEKIWHDRNHSIRDAILRANIALFGASFFLIVFFLPAYTYRLSVKSTAFIWLPILWIIREATSTENPKTRLELIHKSSWGRLVALLSVGTLALLAAKIAIYHGGETSNGTLNHWHHYPAVSHIAKLVAKEFHDIVVPFELPPWQIASAINSILALALFFYASHQLIRLSNSEEVTNANRILRTASTIRTALSLYTSACLFYIVARLAWSWNWPPLGGQFVPWQ